MFRLPGTNHYRGATFLCLRRGVSAGSGSGLRLPRFSLPTQRCFWLLEQMKRRACLFSAYAEVFLLIDTRGLKRTLFSLPTQRCFQALGTCSGECELFSAYAEVFLRLGLFMPRMSPFLCLRRGVSRLVDGAPVSGCFSLPTQRCFHWSGNSRAPDGAFLCLRRGVSRPGAFPSGRIGFSLPTQRCFHPQMPADEFQ